MLDDRKMKVLHAIINSYIISAEPIGSRTISKEYNIGVSSATIRNEMSDLEELGYLNKPHTSAGRIPSDKAYRLYVDAILNQSKNLEHENSVSKNLKKILLKEVREMEELIQNATKILAGVTNYTALAMTPQLKESTLKHIQLVSINENKILIVIVNDSGIVKNTTFRVDKSISEEQLNLISNFLNKKLKGLTLEEISEEIKTGLLDQLYDYKTIVENIIPIISHSLNRAEDVDVISDGVTNIFNFPEYKDIARARTFISFLEEKDLVVDLLLNNTHDDIDIVIGNENSYDEIKDCSLIIATYKFAGETIGKIGVIGPTRMDYYRVIDAVKMLSVNLTEVLDKYFAK